MKYFLFCLLLILTIVLSSCFPAAFVVKEYRNEEIEKSTKQELLAFDDYILNSFKENDIEYGAVYFEGPAWGMAG